MQHHKTKKNSAARLAPGSCPTERRQNICCRILLTASTLFHSSLRQKKITSEETSTPSPSTGLFLLSPSTNPSSGTPRPPAPLSNTHETFPHPLHLVDVVRRGSDRKQIVPVARRPGPVNIVARQVSPAAADTLQCAVGKRAQAKLRRNGGGRQQEVCPGIASDAPSPRETS